MQLLHTCCESSLCRGHAEIIRSRLSHVHVLSPRVGELHSLLRHALPMPKKFCEWVQVQGEPFLRRSHHGGISEVLSCLSGKRHHRQERNKESLRSPPHRTEKIPEGRRKAPEIHVQVGADPRFQAPRKWGTWQAGPRNRKWRQSDDFAKVKACQGTPAAKP